MSQGVIERLGLPGAPEALPMPTVDAHTHLDSTQRHSGLDLADALALAADVGVNRIVQIGCDLASARWSVAAAAENPRLVTTVAIHPNDVGRMSDAAAEQAWQEIDALAGAGPHVRGVGETGLDYFRTTDPQAITRQQLGFRRHIATATDHDLTLVIHDRDAHADVLRILDEEGWPARVVFHCFSADDDFARRALRHNAWLSFAGNVTYQANRSLRDALAITPADRVLVETDAPYLTPLPHRGKANASYLLPHTVRFVAAQLGLELAEACERFAANADAAFGGPWGVASSEAHDG